jgi:uncharacterized repeat protein (TIGR01451 family)
VDPAAPALSVTKTALKDRVAVGEFVPYELLVENRGALSGSAVVISDRLPPGFRYEPGSTVLDGVVVADPGISADRRSLEFPVGDIADGERRTLRYVAEITAGARPGRARNVAVARDADGRISFEAGANVDVTDDLFRNRARLVGRVTAAECGTDPAGLPGVRLLLEDGQYVVTDDEGRYHFESLIPGSHVIRLDPLSLPPHHTPGGCPEDPADGPRLAAASSRVLDLQGGTLWREDFRVRYDPAPPPTGEVSLRLSSSLDDFLVDYAVRLRVSGVPLEDLRLTLMLPDGVRYLPGSLSEGPEERDDPEIGDGTLVLRMGDAPADTEREWRFRGTVAADADAGALVTSALLLYDSPAADGRRTEVVRNVLTLGSAHERVPRPDVVIHPHFETLSAALREEDRRELDAVVDRLRGREILYVHASGHSDRRSIPARAQAEFADNYALSTARARTVARYLAAALDLSEDQVTIFGYGPDLPLDPSDTPEAWALNRRVGLRFISDEVRESTAPGAGQDTAETAAATTGLPDKPAGLPANPAAMDFLRPPVLGAFDATVFRDTTAAWAWHWPPPSHSPPIPSIKIVVRHPADARIALSQNGAPVPALNFDETILDSTETMAASLWTGVDLKEGDNVFEVRAAAGDSLLLRHVVHYSGPPVYAELVEDPAGWIADGRTPPRIVIRLSDREGHAARPGVTGEFSVDAPHRALQELEALRQDPLSAGDGRRVRYVVGADGRASLDLQPTAQPGEAVVRVPLQERTQEFRVWLASPAREWILVGLGEGEAGFRSLSGRIDELDPTLDDDYWADGRLAFYAKGRVRGEWLLTLALDTDRAADDRRDRLQDLIDPDEVYTLYGDATEQGADAASREKLYARVERDRFYALFGDLETGLTVNELARYDRRLTGFKAEAGGGAYDLDVFAANPKTGDVRDEIPGQGVSGTYRFSHRDILPNSEVLVREVRDRFRSDVVRSERRLLRHVDYEIDYAAGTVFFREPLPSRDANLDPVTVVATYEVEGDGDAHATWGGRGAGRLAQGRLEMGGTFVREGGAAGDADLYGLDLRVGARGGSNLRAETARTDSPEAGRNSAWRVEATGRRDAWTGSAWIRDLEGGFGLGQTPSTESGTRKVGGELDYRGASPVQLSGLAYRQTNRDTQGVRDVREGRIGWNRDRWNVHTGLRHAEDRTPGEPELASTQFRTGGSAEVWNRNVKLRLDHDQSIADRNDNPDFPTRTVAGVDWLVHPDVTLFTTGEVADGAAFTARNVRTGLRASPWSGGSLSSAVGREFRHDTGRSFATIGLLQAWSLGPRWTVDAGIDHGRSEEDSLFAAFDADVAPASQTALDFTSTTLGATYRGDQWQANARWERMFAEENSGWLLAPGVLAEPNDRIGLSGRGRFEDRKLLGGDRFAADVRLAMAYRPPASRWTVLHRLDWVHEDDIRPDRRLRSRRIAALAAQNHRARDWQFSLQEGFRYAHETIDGLPHDAFTTFASVELRRDIGRFWDVGAHHRVLRTWNSGRTDFGAGLSVGRSLAGDLWMSVGYEVAGLRDTSFDANATARGPFVRLRVRLDEASVGKWARRFRDGS